ncbi:hypothetical protein WN982_10555 [Paraburkholderia sp. IMGN_8]|uniref:hypothetical protein n=1 Tax=Paraburkholderia sp. IMGN_8 TaxID=3136564 RepID=UPI0031014673
MSILSAGLVTYQESAQIAAALARALGLACIGMTRRLPRSNIWLAHDRSRIRFTGKGVAVIDTR